MMLVAIGTADGKTMNPEHFGHSNTYLIYEFDGTNFIKKEERKNPYAETHLHAKVDEILEFLGDCKVWVGISMGKSSKKRLKELGYIPITVDTPEVSKALELVKMQLQG
ncbi:dinitrogenase iron-molybdenum cofactor biosynthesis protein [Thermosipho affectus]|uniref:Dinitrogenase iron-molybdenum cofactor biosynthesis protein n=2 Tax=Fervidobacteriaceae TaxID=1643950 RepID=A0ABX3IH09_9BACT|nr:dinitrogenase iron-molybdenum cofactor biosynthesis protein [Thermosipho sp. 1070]APT72595.1 dinitrogenase iron-molybdenum cofactor biosynthesis protein [Thermosipho sp. 1063]ONN26599.1 dinitrogenase iron-molybdenum cofactor biosynthesis protein [Thermosipho affectus]OOC41994.1 dinitrogenase iron-molybdenum cofactor biosynthesis protein [Thermosipho sp. 1074]